MRQQSGRVGRLSLIEDMSLELEITLPFCRGDGRRDSLAELRNAGALWLTENKHITRNPQFRIPQAANHRAREEKSVEM